MLDLFLFIGIGIFIGFVAWHIIRGNNYKELAIDILVSCVGAVGGSHVAGTLDFTLSNDRFIAGIAFSVIGAVVISFIVHFFKKNN